MNRSFALAFLLAVAGCGGHAAKYRFDDVAIAQVPIDDKRPIFEAEQAVPVAKALLLQREAEIEGTKNEIALAKLELDRAKLQVESARLESQAAEKSHDTNRIAPAKGKESTADLGQRAAQAKVDMLEGKKDWQKEQRRLADLDIDAALARVENEKAKLAVAKNIRPKDFRPEDYSNELSNRTLKVDGARRDVEAQKLTFDRLTETYRSLDARAAGEDRDPRIDARLSEPAGDGSTRGRRHVILGGDAQEIEVGARRAALVPE